MKKTITALSLLSGLVAVLSVILNIQVLFNGNSWFFRFAMFSITRGGAFMTVMAIISLICSISKGIFNFGDIIVLAMPAVYTFCLFSASDELGE